MLSIVAVLVLEDGGTGMELGVRQTNLKLCLLTLLLHLRTDEWHSDSRSHSRGASMREESPFLRLINGNSCACNVIMW